MSLNSLVDYLSQDTLASLAAFQPELWLCAAIVAILLMRVIGFTSQIDAFYVALVGSALGLWCAAPWQNLDQMTGPVAQVVPAGTDWYEVADSQENAPAQGAKPAGKLAQETVVWVKGSADAFAKVKPAGGAEMYVAASSLRAVYRQPIFTGLLVYDSLTIFFRIVLFAFALLFVIFTRISGIPDREAAPDFYVLVLGGILGMCLMASSNHLLMVFLGVEMASVPSYALAGMLKGRRKSSEAALKYAVYGAGAAGVMLYGISLLAGVIGSVHIPTMATRLAAALQTDALGANELMVLCLGGLMVMVGLAFKLSAVPFHFWCPDVFEGASAEVNAFLSVASKAAALALLVRVAVGFSYLTPPEPTVQPTPVAAVFSVADQVDDKAPASDAKPAAASEQHTPELAKLAPSEQVQSLGPVRSFIVLLLSVISVITCTFGNLAAYGQNNIKRMLAYSTIAHAGYMIMPVAAAVALAGIDPTKAATAIGALTFYVGVYLFMNLGAFAVVAFLRNELHSENVLDYAGLIRRAPALVVAFTAILISLVGLPPLAGFVGKFAIFSALVEAKLWTLLVVAGLNTAISLYYYLRVVKIMTIDPEPDNRVPVTFSFIPNTFVVAITLPVLLLGIWPDAFNQWAQAAARHLFS